MKGQHQSDGSEMEGYVVMGSPLFYQLFVDFQIYVLFCTGSMQGYLIHARALYVLSASFSGSGDQFPMEEIHAKSDLFRMKTLYGLRRGGKECSI